MMRLETEPGAGTKSKPGKRGALYEISAEMAEKLLLWEDAVRWKPHFMKPPEFTGLARKSEFFVLAFTIARQTVAPPSPRRIRDFIC